MDVRDKLFEQKFSGLNDGCKDYVLAILQALEFAGTNNPKDNLLSKDSEKEKNVKH